MEWLGELGRRLWFVFRRRQFDRDLEEEIRFHTGRKAEAYREAGMDPEEARYAALRQFGNATLLAEESRAAWGWQALERFAGDVRFSLRLLTRNLGLTVAAVLTMALGVGANSTIFSVVDAFLFRPPPVKDPGRLVSIAARTPQQAGRPISYPNFVDWKQQNKVFDHIAAYRVSSFVIAGDDGADRVPGMQVSADFFEILGMKPVIGRAFLAEEHRAGGRPVALISHEIWQRLFGGGPSILGKTIRVQNGHCAVVGVAPPGFRLGPRADIYVPLEPYAKEGRASANSLYAIGRLKAGVTWEQARSQMDAISKRLEELYPETNKDYRADLLQFGRLRRGELRAPLLMLLAAVGLVLLIACANISNLLLAKAADRGQEIAVRKALGAGRTRLVSQMLTESLVLAVTGGAAGLLAGFWGCRLLPVLTGDLDEWPGGAPLGGIGIDGRVLAFTLTVVLLAGLVMGLAPALHTSGTSLTNRAVTRKSRRIFDTLVASEVMLAFVLLCGAGLLARSLYHLLAQDRGFDSARILTVSLTRAEGRPQEETYRRILEELQALPGVQAAAAAFPLPFGHGFSGDYFHAEGTPDPGRGHYLDVRIRFVTAGYFQTLGMQLRKGRWLTFPDCRPSPNPARAAVINELLARQAWPGQDPVGRRFRLGTPVPDSPWITVVGVAATTKENGLDGETGPEIHLPVSGSSGILVRSAGAPLSLVPAIRSRIRSVDRNEAAYDIYQLEERILESVHGWRALAWLLGIFAGIAALLSAVGIYAVISHSVTRRTKELGLRAALGAEPGEVQKLVLRQGMLPVLVGIAAGTVCALATTRVLSAFLFGVKATDPLTFVTTGLFLCAVALLACYLPARRATRIDPMTALRYE
ncbi:MAG: ABC transporter permease [Thermoguttaceae bacterium]|nr:ABC transporter permease [Thermoguttaceae bacterium]